MSIRIGAVIMASGMARRFGSNKLLHDFRGEPLMLRILRSMKESDVDLPVVVTRHPEVTEICRKEGIQAVLHDLPKRNDTVRLGVEYLLEKVPDLDGIMFAASDQPCLKAESIMALCSAFRQNPDNIYRLSHQGAAGNPVLFPRKVFEELLHLPEGKGGGAVIKKHPEQVRLIEASDEKELIDVDTPEILARLLQDETDRS